MVFILRVIGGVLLLPVQLVHLLADNWTRNRGLMTWLIGPDHHRVFGAKQIGQALKAARLKIRTAHHTKRKQLQKDSQKPSD